MADLDLLRRTVRHGGCPGVHTGVMEVISRAATAAVQGWLLLASLGLLWVSAFLSAIIDNIPYVATMSPIVADLVAASGDGQSPLLLNDRPYCRQPSRARADISVSDTPGIS